MKIKMTIMKMKAKRYTKLAKTVLN